MRLAVLKWQAHTGVSTEQTVAYPSYRITHAPFRQQGDRQLVVATLHGGLQQRELDYVPLGVGASQQLCVQACPQLRMGDADPPTCVRHSTHRVEWPSGQQLLHGFLVRALQAAMPPAQCGC